jgi:hypothetical protein
MFDAVLLKGVLIGLQGFPTRGETSYISCMYSSLTMHLPIEQKITMLFRDIRIHIYPNKKFSKNLGSIKCFDVTCGVLYYQNRIFKAGIR